MIYTNLVQRCESLGMPHTSFVSIQMLKADFGSERVECLLPGVIFKPFFQTRKTT